MGRVQRAPCFQCRCRKVMYPLGTATDIEVVLTPENQVRCDRRPTGCVNCERLGFLCSFQQNNAGGHRSPGTPKSSRNVKNVTDEGYHANTQPRNDPEMTDNQKWPLSCFPFVKSTPDSDRSGLTLMEDDILRIINDFFTNLYPIPAYAFHHEPSIRHQCMNNALDQNLRLSIAAITTLYLSNNQRHLDETVPWIAKVETDIWNHLEKPSITQLQSLLLVVHCHIQIGQFSRAYMLAGLAARAVTALRLNYERPELSLIAQETRRRVLWALTFIDGSFSVGLPEYETIPHTIIYQRLPISEDAFWNGAPENRLTTYQPTLTSDLDPDSPQRCSLLGACIRLSKISKDIMRLTRQLALAEQPLSQLSGLVQEIQNDLWRLHSDVEHTFAYDVDCSRMVSEKVGSRWFARFLQVSVTWHQAHCDLYRLFVPRYPEAAPQVIMETVEPSLRAHALDACAKHVTHINQILRGLRDLDVTPVLPSYIAVCAYHATRLTLFLPSALELGLQLGLKAADAVEGAGVALEVLERFFSRVPAARSIVLDMRRLVRLAQEEPHSVYRELCSAAPAFGHGRDRHSHLAIHSLVRQANFVDEGYDGLQEHWT
ncbi:hypothetical protein N7462_006571 [Penicillium macrosclerotiorum]|uniref:uncharacterized protein n=1 Tax=Penicillium macrosclerotiorum TaxID=303699 RepID=UPI00254999A1|nr:uncharacterized protein N7462_006571 [Penicillium macrosclerotiorum]KAJ5683406.1 hypothetical protein N7462_006571 [Penicillium macrosclerotiorum]